MIPFVGRIRELRRLRTCLDSGRSVVVSGAFGSGRTTLVQYLAAEVGADYCITFLDPKATRRELRQLSESSTRRTKTRRLVLVIDDVSRVTARKKAWWREVTRSGLQMIVIVDRTLSSPGVTALRAALGAAPLLSVGPLSRTAAEQYFADCSKAFDLRWTLNEIRGTARSTGGVPLVMRMTLDAALGRARPSGR